MGDGNICIVRVEREVRLKRNDNMMVSHNCYTKLSLRNDADDKNTSAIVQLRVSSDGSTQTQTPSGIHHVTTVIIHRLREFVLRREYHIICST